MAKDLLGHLAPGGTLGLHSPDTGPFVPNDPPEEPGRFSVALEAVRRIAPGLTVVSMGALAAAWLADRLGAPVMLLALLVGMAVNFSVQGPCCQPGLDFAARTILRIGIALLGARITFDQLQGLGGRALLMAAGGIAVTIAVGLGFARVLRLRAEFGLLSGGAVAICGASAALAISAILPPSPCRERQTALTVVGVTGLSTLAMILYPPLTQLLGLSDHQAGLLLGAAIHDVAQVVGAGYSVSPVAGDTAMLIKLLRVALLLPTVVVIALVFRVRARGLASGKRPPLIPLFMVGFALLVAVNSSHWAPAVLIQQAGVISHWSLIAAITAVGAKSSLPELMSLGWRPVALLAIETVAILVVALGILLI